MRSRFIDPCLVEIDEALAWYGKQSPELPGRMVDDLQETIEKLVPFPGW